MEKVFGTLLLILLACTSCGDGNSKSEPSFKVYDKYSKEKKIEEKNDIGRAAYIFWINKAEVRKLRELTFDIERKVTINEDGSIKILGHEGKQSYTVTKSLKKYLKTLHTNERALKKGTVKTGDQIVFLRYIVLKQGAMFLLRECAEIHHRRYRVTCIEF